MRDEIPPCPDLRRRGAQQLTSVIMRTLGAHIDDALLAQTICIEVEDYLEREGFQILTDSIRQSCGLDPVGQYGWTDHEMKIWERMRLLNLSTVQVAEHRLVNKIGGALFVGVNEGASGAIPFKDAPRSSPEAPEVKLGPIDPELIEHVAKALVDESDVLALTDYTRRQAVAAIRAVHSWQK